MIETYPIHAIYARKYTIYANKTNYTINVKKVGTRGLEQKIFVSDSGVYATVLISLYHHNSFLGVHDLKFIQTT